MQKNMRMQGSSCKRIHHKKSMTITQTFKSSNSHKNKSMSQITTVNRIAFQHISTILQMTMTMSLMNDFFLLFLHFFFLPIFLSAKVSTGNSSLTMISTIVFMLAHFAIAISRQRSKSRPDNQLFAANYDVNNGFNLSTNSYVN